MTITFSALVSTITSSWKGFDAARKWLTDAQLKTDFERYLSALEHRRVLYVAWEYENLHGVLVSLAEIVDRTRDLRAAHSKNAPVRTLLGNLISHLQANSDTMRGCDMHTRQGEFMAYKTLLRVRSELAKTLALLCGLLNVDPRSTELEHFIMNMALVRPPK